MSEYCRKEPPTCIVGYALNPKKLRKSNSEIGDLTPPAASSRKQMGVLKPSKDLTKSPLRGPLASPADISTLNQIQLIWRGGGLADIVSGGVTYEGVQFVQWYPEIPAHEQPHFDVIIHKLTEDIEKSSDKIRCLEYYLKLNPHTIVVDPLESVRNVVSRARSCECLRKVQIRLGKGCPFSQPDFFIAIKPPATTNDNNNDDDDSDDAITVTVEQPEIPETDADDNISILAPDEDNVDICKIVDTGMNSTELPKTTTYSRGSSSSSRVHVGSVSGPDDMLALMEREGLKFPIICKPVEACGTARSHSMVVVVSPEGLSLVQPPCVVQQYRDHDAFFYKVYVMDDEVMVFQRGSLPNLAPYIKVASEEATHIKGESSCACSARTVTNPTILDDNSNGDRNSNSNSNSNSGSNGLQRRLCSVAFDSRNAYPSIEDFFLHHHSQQASQEPMDDDNEDGDEFDGFIHRLRKKERANSTLSEGNSAATPGTGRRGGGKETPVDRDCLGSRHVPEDRFRAAAMAIKEEFGLSLFGFDVIVPSSSFAIVPTPPTSTSNANIPGSNHANNINDSGSNYSSSNSTRGCGHHSSSSSSSSCETSTTTTATGTADTVAAAAAAVATTAKKQSDDLELELVVIDINFFPSYKEVPDFPSRLRAFLRKKAGLS